MNLQELREKAEKAPDRLPVVRPHTAPTREDLDAVEHYAAFHAVANPSLVLALLDVVEKAEKILPMVAWLLTEERYIETNYDEKVAGDAIRASLTNLNELLDSL